jgi:hypothetical protein
MHAAVREFGVEQVEAIGESTSAMTLRVPR